MDWMDFVDKLMTTDMIIVIGLLIVAGLNPGIMELIAVGLLAFLKGSN